MSTHSHHAPGFVERTAAYHAATAKAAREWYNAEGEWIATGKPSETRERFWGAFSLYAAGSHALADAVVRKGDTQSYRGVYFNIFDTNIAVALLVNHKQVMAPDVRAKLERLARDGFNFKPGNRQPDYQFHGYNDNMPSKGTMGLILGGEMLNDPEAVAYGVWDLRQLANMLFRRGTNSEYNSPTYIPLTIHSMAEIAEHARDPVARETALAIEQRLWYDLAARFHPETGVVAGPYSRAYNADTLAQLSIVSSLLWFNLGDLAKPSTMQLFEPKCDLVLHHMGDVPFNVVQMSYFAAGTYHIPKPAMELFHHKKYPYRAVATAEMGDYGSDGPGRATLLTSYLAKDFTVATSDTGFLGGGAPYMATYRRTQPIKTYRDTGTLYYRMTLDDDVPGTIRHAKAIPPAGAEPMGMQGKPSIQYDNFGEEDYLNSYANCQALQADTTVAFLTTPAHALGGDEDRAGWPAGQPRTFHRLSDLIISPTHFGGAEEINVGGHKRADWSGPVPHGQWIAARRGRLYVGFRPLAYSRHFGHAPIVLEKVNRYEVIRSTHYKGEPRTFTVNELKQFFGGFVAEHASVDEFPSLDAFVHHLQDSKVTDYLWMTRRFRYARPSHPARPGVDMEISISPGSVIPRYATINGHPVSWPIAQYDGVDSRTLPILNKPFHPLDPFWPWKDLSVEWGDWPSAIGDKEI